MDKLSPTITPPRSVVVAGGNTYGVPPPVADNLPLESIVRLSPTIIPPRVSVVAGGNSFYLLQALKDKDILHELTDFARKNTYIGTSAGACIACPTIDYVKGLDDITQAPHLNDYTAMNLVNFYILPHYDSKEKYTKLANEIEYAYKNRTFIKLSDNQAIIIHNPTDYKIVDTD